MHTQTLLPLLSLLALSVSGTAGLAAANRKKRPSRSTGRGFGAAPPSFADVAAKVRTRLPPNACELPCPCGSPDAAYGECCEPYHSGVKPCETPASVLRSRYSAFAYRLPGHIIRTTHPACRDYRANKMEWLKDLDRTGMFDSFEFVELIAGQEEFSKENPDSEAFVEFKVRVRPREDEEGSDADASAVEGDATVIIERSRFLRSTVEETDESVDNLPQWTYAGGAVRLDVKGLEDTVLNQ